MRTRVTSDFRFLFLALLALALASPLAGPRFYASGLRELIFGAVMLSAVFGSVSSRRSKLSHLALGLAATGAMVASHWLETGPTPAAQGLLAAGFLLATAWQVLRTVLSTQEVGSREIAGALSVYLLLGLAWAFFYGLVLMADPAAIRIPGGSSLPAAGSLAGGTSREDYLTYYSFVTLTTLGYGDITPVSSLARTLAWMEALLGQFYMAVLVARLVGLTIATPAARRPKP